MICLKLKNVFVSNYKMYLCQISKCTCVRLQIANCRWWPRCWGSSTPGGRRRAWKPWPATCWRQLTSKNFLSKQHLFYCKIPKNGWKRYCKILYRAKKKSLSQDIIFFSWNLTWVSCKKDNLYWQIPSIFSFSCCRIIC